MWIDDADETRVTISNVDIKKLSIHGLLALHCDALGELQNRGVLRTMNNPTGDYAEWLVSQAFGLSLAGNSVSDYDAISESGKKIQIKARRVTPTSKSRQLSAMRNLDAEGFDELVVVIFDESFHVAEAYLIPHSVVCEYASYRAHVNGHVLHARGALLSDPRVQDISAEIRAAQRLTSMGETPVPGYEGFSKHQAFGA